MAATAQPTDTPGGTMKRKPQAGAVASAPAAFRVRVWHIPSRGWDPWTERPLPEVVRVAYPPSGFKVR